MDKKEEELLSMHYQIEKTDIKQQRLEDRLVLISEDLKKSKNIRNFYFIFIIFLMAVIAAGGFYLIRNDMSFQSENDVSENSKEMKQLLLINDSLQQEVVKLKSDISTYKNNTLDTIDSIKMYTENLLLESIEKEQSAPQFSKDTSKLKFKKIHCYVNKVFKSNNAIFIEADFIEYYKGKKAVKKAKEYGDAEYDIDKNGDTLYFLYNNYYIHNQNSRPKILELDDRARVKIDNINQISNGFPLKAFQKIITNKPILILETNNGIVYKITQQKLP